jgi:hypothetical protein
MRTALWELMAPMLSPHLIVASRDSFVFDELVEGSTVDLTERARERDLADVDLGDDQPAIAA